MSTGNNDTTTTIEVSSGCKVYEYIRDMLPCITCVAQKDIDVELEAKAEHRFDLYQPNQDGKSFSINIDGNSVTIIVSKELTPLHIKIIINYLLNHNGLGELNNLCFVENCSLRESSECTMRSLDKIVNKKGCT